MTEEELLLQQTANGNFWLVLIVFAIVVAIIFIYLRFRGSAQRRTAAILAAAAAMAAARGVPPPGAPPATPPAPAAKTVVVTYGNFRAGAILWVFMIGVLLALGIAILRFKETWGFENFQLPLEIEIGVLIGVVVVITAIITPAMFRTTKVITLFVGIFILAVCAGFSDTALAQMKIVTDDRSMAGGREETINCPAEWVTVPPGQTASFQPAEGCKNLRWEREEGDYTTFLTFEGSNGHQEASWHPGRPPAYRGAYVTTVAICHDNVVAVSYRFFYVN